MTNTRGYIAIITAVIVTALVLGLVVLVGHGNFLGAFDTQQLELRDGARFLAEGCLEHARLELAGNSSYVGGEVVTVGSSTCSIGSVTVVGTSTIIQASTAVGGAVVQLQMTVDSSTLDPVSLVEY